MKRKSSSSFKLSIKNGKKLIVFLLVFSFMFSLTSCGGKEIVNNSDMVEYELSSEPLIGANNATTLAVRQYVYARLKTEDFVTADLYSMTRDEISIMVTELTEIWGDTLLITKSTEELIDQAIEKIEESKTKQTSSIGREPFFAYAVGPLSLANKNFDPKVWAENLTKQYDDLKGGNTIKQLAKQLGTDAKEAYEKLVFAQEIINNIAMADAEYYDAMYKVAQGVKTTCKVGLFVSSAVATGGGSFSALAASTVTAAEGGALIVGGVDCVIDVASTGSNIVLGENHQVAVGFEDVKNNFAPISAVVGLVTFDPDQTGNSIAYIGDSIIDLLYDNKIMGVKITNDKKGTKIAAKAIDVAEKSEKEVKDVIISEGFKVPMDQPLTNETSIAREEMAEKFKIEKEEVLSMINDLKSQLEKVAKIAKDIGDNAEAGNAKEALEKLGIKTLTGTYFTKSEIIQVQVVSDLDDNEEESMEVYRAKQTNLYEGATTEGETKFIQEGDTLTLIDEDEEEDGEDNLKITYNPKTGLWESKKENMWGMEIVEGKITSTNDIITIKVLITATFEKTKIPDGVNIFSFEFTKSK